MSASLSQSLSSVLPGLEIQTGDACRAWAVAGLVPEVVAFPASTEEVSALLEAATHERWRVVPAGGGTCLGDGSLPERVDVVISTRALDRIVEYEPADLTVTAQAGTTLGALEAVCREQGQWLPLDPPGGAARTLGGMLATAASGPLRASYGTPRDHVLGLTLVAGDGRVLKFGGKVVKNVAGFDLGKLVVGSWGTLGIIVSATLRLYPTPDRDVTVLAWGTSRDRMIETARAAATSGLLLTALEYVEPGGTIHPPAGGDPMLVVRMAGGAPPVEETAREISSLFLDMESSRVESGASRSLHDKLGRIEQDASLVARLALLPSHLRELLDLGDEVVRAALVGSGQEDGQACLAVHVTRGQLRLVVDRVGDGADRLKSLAGSLASVRERLEASSGSLRITRGPAGLLGSFDAWGDPGSAGRLAAGIRRVFDPAGTMASGRFAV